MEYTRLRPRAIIILVIRGIHVLETDIYNCWNYLWKTCVGDRDLQLFELSVEYMCWRQRSTIVQAMCGRHVLETDLQLFEPCVEDMCWRTISTIVRVICGRHVLETEIYNCSSYLWKTCDGRHMFQTWIYNCSSYLRKTCDGDRDLQLLELSAEDICW